MSETYSSNTDLATIAGRIKKARRIVLTTHTKPDGDAVGSTLGLARAIHRLDKRAQLWYMGPMSNAFKKILDPTPYEIVAPGRFPPPDADLVIICDTGAQSQVRELETWLAQRHDSVCVIDHHIQGDNSLSSLRIVDPDASAAAEIAAALIGELGVALDAPIAQALYLGIATDTGWFRFSNTRAQTHRLAAQLMENGADHCAIYRLVEQTDTIGRIRLLARGLSGMKLLAGDRVALILLRNSDFESTGAAIDESHGLSDLPLSIETVQVSCVVCETPAGHVKLSLRSKPGQNAIDVNAIARQFGGGGHARASGAKLDGPVDEVYNRAMKLLGAL